jgi:GntR family transcriptional regulator, transcriptional repressor for pyruvate dehydrogenase complex
MSNIETGLKAAAARMRELSLATEPGELLGGEEALIGQLGFSRSTIRQAARLLEREGLLRVRRGPSGGYFAARPDAISIAETVASYLQTIELDGGDINLIASALYVEVVRKAAGRIDDEGKLSTQALRSRVLAVKPTATFTQVHALEKECRDATFVMANSHYVELIFNINTAFAHRAMTTGGRFDQGPAHLGFVQTWRTAKALELSAICDGDPELAALAARHLRKVWDERIWERLRQL